ncbi:MAG: type IV toxin-antitoxin system AbiEi family antitoxin [Actinomycetaceae bacterium]|nr:type IV toxin-antitoxin system AbiEi family antitoxin [Actinomycetaceae bacterium]
MQNLLISQVIPTAHSLHTTPVTSAATLIHPEDTPAWELERARVITILKASNQRSRYPQYATGLTAARLLGLPILKAPDTIEVISKAPSNPRRTSFQNSHQQIRRLQRAYPAEAYTEIKGFPMVSPNYLILEVLRLPDAFAAFVTADAILRSLLATDHRLVNFRQYDIQQAKEALLEIATPEVLGRLTKRVTHRIPLLDPYAESPAESILRLLLLQLGFASLQSQHEVINPHGGFFYGDILIPELKTICEADGAGKYADAHAYRTEKERETILTRAGYRVIRMHWKELTSSSALQILASKLGVDVPRRPREI